MLLQILTYTHHLTTMLFGIFLSAFFLGVKQNKDVYKRQMQNNVKRQIKTVLYGSTANLQRCIRK